MEGPSCRSCRGTSICDPMCAHHSADEMVWHDLILTETSWHRLCSLSTIRLGSSI